MASEAVETHPIQTNLRQRPGSARVPKIVALKAYEVYAHVYGAQPAMIDLEGRGCRGGFSIGEYVAFLYASSFPKSEWRDRVEQALTGLSL